MALAPCVITRGGSCVEFSDICKWGVMWHKDRVTKKTECGFIKTSSCGASDLRAAGYVAGTTKPEKDYEVLSRQCFDPLFLLGRLPGTVGCVHLVDRKPNGCGSTSKGTDDTSLEACMSACLADPLNCKWGVQYKQHTGTGRRLLSSGDTSYGTCQFVTDRECAGESAFPKARNGHGWEIMSRQCAATIVGTGASEPAHPVGGTDECVDLFGLQPDACGFSRQYTDDRSLEKCMAACLANPLVCQWGVQFLQYSAQHPLGKCSFIPTRQCDPRQFPQAAAGEGYRIVI